MSPQAPQASVSDEEIDALLAAHSNWGRWGADDQLGTLNLVTSSSVQRAAGRVVQGQTIGLGRTITTQPSADQLRPPQHVMTEIHADAGARMRGTASDWLGIGPHGFAITHVDALCHQSWRGRMYNDRSVAAVTARAGVPVLGVEALADGLFVPAVLLDLPRILGVDFLAPGEAVGAAELARAVELTGVGIAPGDALVISTGREAREQVTGRPDPLEYGNPGLSVDAARWLDEISPSVVVTDVQCDVMRPGEAPHPMPLHVVCLVGLGIHLVDNARLDALVAATRDGRAAGFALGLAPLSIKRGTGSPVVPTAVF